jgi:hypothetical protein
MSVAERIGLDLGAAPEAGRLAAEAAEVGAAWARVRFALRDGPVPDEAFLASARATVDELCASNLRVLAVIDGDLTVAAGGAGAFEEPPRKPLAEAWAAELCGNATRLAEALGEHVVAWEVLPLPNVGQPPRIAPSRWAALLAAVAAAIRSAAPGAMVVAGGLLCDERDDGVEYLQAALGAAAAGLWPDARPPFDALGLELRLLADGGPSEDLVAAALSERLRRLWRVLERFEGTVAATEHGVLVTGVGWDSSRTGEDVQARNLWTALDTLTTDGIVRAVVWSGLQDTAAAASGLSRPGEPAATGRRPAWRAFNDFAHYARQIGAPAPAAVLLAPLAGESLEVPGPEAAAPVTATAVAAAIATAGPDDGTEVVFRIPDAAEVLRAQGLEGPRLEAALVAVTAKYGGYEWLPPGEYRITLSAGEPAPAQPTYTNQQIISALYRAGDGSWSLFERSGLVLSQLASRRNDPYSGPPIESLGALSEAERETVLEALREAG